MSRVFGKIDKLNLPFYVWTGGLWLTAGLTGLLLWGDAPMPSLWIVAGLALLAAVAERQSVPVGRNTEASVAFLPLVFAAVAFGPFTALVVGALAALGDFRRPYLRWAVYLPIRTLTAAAAGIAASAVPHDRTAFGQILLASLAASVADLAADLFFNLGTQAVRRAGSPYALIRTLAPLIVVLTPLYTPLVALLVYGYQLYSVAIVGAFLVPAIALQRLIHLYQEQREAVSSLEEVNARLERASLSFASALVATLDARDRYTAGHSAAVAVYSRDIGARMGLSDEEQALIHLCGLVHDIGKVGLPPGLLEKPGPLTLEERRQMEQHAAIGERILSRVDDYAEIARVVRHHHERVDGLGYPDGLSGDEIPLAARIISVADAYNAMTSDRPYRDAMPSRVARLRLAQAVEAQFDTAVVAAFEAVLAGASEAYRSGQREDFSIEIRDAEEVLHAVAR
jgi:HD-GYP domain-containing protein (c-di-GMP phosphodiesterase class II)